jgi:hypothetical protein
MGVEFLAAALPSTTSSDQPPYFSHLTSLNLRKDSYSLKNPVQIVYSKADKSNRDQKHNFK